MTDDDWALLKMLPPSDNHDPFHDYVTLNGNFTAKGTALLRFAVAISDHATNVRKERAEDVLE